MIAGSPEESNDERLPVYVRHNSKNNQVLVLLHLPKQMTVEVNDFNERPTVSCYAIISIFNVIFYVVNS